MSNVAVGAALVAIVGVLAVTTRDETAARVEMAAAPQQQAGCRNSTDPACGEFRWDPQPTNNPMTVVVRASTTNPRVGELVTFDVEATDDTRFVPAPQNCRIHQQYGDEGFGWGGCDYGCDIPPQYGPWDPPAATEGRVVDRFTHTYERPGSYVATFDYESGEPCTRDPYVSRGQATITITVSDAPAAPLPETA